MKLIKTTACIIFLCTFFGYYHSKAQSWAWAQYIPWSLNIPPEEVPVLGVKVNNEAIVHDASGSAYVAGHIHVGTGVPGPTGDVIYFISRNIMQQVRWSGSNTLASPLGLTPKPETW